VDGTDRLIAYATTRDRAASGTTPWTRQDLEVPVDSTATAITFGALLAGDGVAWFDHFRLALDGLPYEEPLAPPIVDPAPAAIDWLRARAIPFDTDDPDHDDSDLVPILHVIGNARVLGLGEGTHGTREFSRMKHRLVRALVEELGFRLFAMESDFSGTERLNHYVLTGEGDPRDILRGMRLWTWNTEEVLALVRWIRAYNASGRDPVQFLGFDMQQPIAAIDSLSGFIRRADPDFGGALAESLRIVARAHEADARGAAGSAAALLRGEPFSGKRVRLSGWIKTEAIDEGEAALWLRADGDSARPVYDGMEGRGPSGTTGWARYTVEVRVPAGTRRVAFGATLRGDGAAWFDSLGMEVDGRPVHSGTTFDFNFETRRPIGGLRTAGSGYRSETDSTTARFGRRSLVIRQDAVTADAARGDRWARAVGAAEGVLRHVEAESLLLATRAEEPEVARAIQNARLVLQSCRAFANPPTRDASMAENAAWLLSRAPAGSKLILWAHNAHVSRHADAMGSYLAARYGSGYMNLGFAFHEGSYIASERRGLDAFPAMPSQPGSLEWALHRTGLPRLALDLRQASPEDPASAWLTGELDFRSIGALPVLHGFYRTPVAHDFDAVIFFDRTTPSRPLPSRVGP
jgi:erythromycin esterase-like protein